MRWIGFPLRLVIALIFFPLYLTVSMFVWAGQVVFDPDNLLRQTLTDVRKDIVKYWKWVPYIK